VTFGRVSRHALLGATSLGVIFVFYTLFSDRAQWPRLSLASAYAALLLLAVTFALGPYYFFVKRREPVSTHLRRDFAIWGGALALGHTLLGLQAHFHGKMWAYFIIEDWRGQVVPIRFDAFGLANYAGAFAAAIIIVLLVISNDFAIRRIGISRWRRIQSWATVCAWLSIAHALAYQVLERRALWVVIVFATIVVAVAASRMLRAGACSYTKSG